MAVSYIVGELAIKYNIKFALMAVAGAFAPAFFYSLTQYVSVRFDLSEKRKQHVMRMRLFASILICLCSFMLGALQFYAANGRSEKAMDTLKRIDLNDADIENYINEPYELKLDAVKAEGIIVQAEEKKSGWWIYIRDARIYTEISKVNAGVVVICDHAPKIGSTVSLSGSLGMFSSATNPGVFDQREYYHNLGYDFIINCENITTLKNSRMYLSNALLNLRQSAKNILKKLCTDEDFGVYCAMLLGDKGELDDDIYSSFKSQGIAHILSVSGLHISAIGMLIYRFIRKEGAGFGIAGIAAGLVAACYGIMTGSSVSTVRAVIMFIIMSGAACKGRVYDMSAAAAAAAIIILWENPFACFLPAMQLSFMAVIGLSLVTDSFRRFIADSRHKRLKILPMLCLQLALLPVILYSFYQLPLYSVLINLLILPFCAILLVIPAASIASFELIKLICTAVPTGIIGENAAANVSKLILKTGHVIIGYYRMVCKLSENLPGSIIHTGKPSIIKIVIYYAVLMIIALASCLIQRKRKKKGLFRLPKLWQYQAFIAAVGAILVWILGVFFLSVKSDGQLKVTMLDVGQGDCFLIELPDGSIMLSDAGSSSKISIAEYIIEPVLLSKGLSCVDYVLLSHADEDHISGIEELINNNNIRINELLVPSAAENSFSQLIDLAKKNGLQTEFIGKDDYFYLSDCKFEIYAPKAGSYSEDENSLSLVYGLFYKNFSMLFTGDLPITAESALPKLHKFTVLKAAHHGSKNSCSEDFLSNVLPDIVLISYGRGNLYGHPSKETLNRLEAVNASVYKSGLLGAVELVTDGKQVDINPFLR